MKHLTTILILLMIAGCAVHESEDCVKACEFEFKTKTKQTLFLYFTKTKQIEKHTPISNLSVGQIESNPDPNSIKAVSEASGSALLSILKHLK